MKDYRIAMYIRLSNADEQTGRGQDESGSITHQRMLLNHFLDSRTELAGCPRSEFVDDGYSGTNTDRPGFQRMVRMVREGAYNLVIVKDLSRFSRDYIETGDYLECVFPFLGVRFISVNEGYDSAGLEGTAGGLEAAVRSIIHAAYSRDLSVKVKTAKQKKGNTLTASPRSATGRTRQTGTGWPSMKRARRSCAGYSIWQRAGQRFQRSRGG